MTRTVGENEKSLSEGMKKAGRACFEFVGGLFSVVVIFILLNSNGILVVIYFY